MAQQLTLVAPAHTAVGKSQNSVPIRTQIPRLLQDRLNVKNKSRSNVFNYRGQFTPELVEYLLQSFAQPGALVVDPFSGSGTVLLESARMGLGCYGLEINPAGYAMSKFFSFANDSVSERETVADELETHICGLTDRLHDAPLFEPRESFRDSYANFLDFCSRLFARTEERKERLLAMNVLFLAEGCKSGTVGASVFSSFRQLKRILLELPFTGLPIHAGLGDARQLDRNCLKPADVILTSPPYINVFNYHQNYRAVLECLGWNLLKIAQSEFGSNRKNRGNRFRTVVQYCLDMEQAIMSFWRCLRDDGLMILVVGRESNVRRVPFYNGQMVSELIEALGAFAPVEKYERVFLNKFGNDIREDIIIVRKNRAEPTGQVARKIALRNLESALDRAEGEAAQDLRDAINEVESVEPSPIFSQEGVFSHAKYTA